MLDTTQQFVVRGFCRWFVHSNASVKSFRTTPSPLRCKYTNRRDRKSHKYCEEHSANAVTAIRKPAADEIDSLCQQPQPVEKMSWQMCLQQASYRTTSKILRFAAKRVGRRVVFGATAFRIDRERHIVNVTYMTGRQLLELAGKCDVMKWKIFQKVCGEMKEVAPGETVDFTRKGVEKFKTLPLDQTEGERLGGVR